MYQYELSLFLKKKLPNKSIYVVPSDLFPTQILLPAGFIVNLSPSDHEGSHWIGIYIDEYGNGVYFCSFAMKPSVKSIQLFLHMHCKTITYNTMQLQATNSKYCGEYAAMFLINAFKGLGLSEYLKVFSTNLIFNDMLIRKMFARSQNFSH